MLDILSNFQWQLISVTLVNKYISWFCQSFINIIKFIVFIALLGLNFPYSIFSLHHTFLFFSFHAVHRISQLTSFLLVFHLIFLSPLSDFMLYTYILFFWWLYLKLIWTDLWCLCPSPEENQNLRVLPNLLLFLYIPWWGDRGFYFQTVLLYVIHEKLSNLVSFYGFCFYCFL